MDEALLWIREPTEAATFCAVEHGRRFKSMFSEEKQSINATAKVVQKTFRPGKLPGLKEACGYEER